MLLNAGHQVMVFDSLERGHAAALDPRAVFIQGDLRERQPIRDAMARHVPDAVMHFAAYALVPESMTKPEAYFRNNVVGGINLAEAMLEHGVRRIVFSSTCATYGEPEEVPIRETTPQRPTNPYGESKLSFEKVLQWYSKLHDFKTIFLRYFNVCGASGTHGEDHDPETHLIPLVLQVALGQREKIHIYGNDYATPDGTCVRDYIHVADLVDAHIRALAVKESRVFNLGNGAGFSVKEVVDAARAVTGHPIPAEIKPRRPGDPPRLIAAAERAKLELGWQPAHTSLHSIIETAWRWHRTHPAGYRSKA
jgi:UDP-glucose 4-epimerase